MTKALEKTYDGVIIGAGHHGLTLGSYLAKAGVNILLVDRRLQYGGGLTTKEVTAPGFYHNLHSINHFHISETPWFKDLGLEDRVTYITPRYEFGQAHSDGTALVFGRDREETIANVARFSKKDAETFREWNRRAEEITAQILIPERFAEPLPQAEREALLEKTAIGRDFLAVSRRQPLDLVRDLFENDHVKLLFLFKVSLFGTWLTDTLSKTSPMALLILARKIAKNPHGRSKSECTRQAHRTGDLFSAKAEIPRAIRFAAETIARVISAALVAKISRAPFRGLLFCALHWRRRTKAVDCVRQFAEAITCSQRKPSSVRCSAQSVGSRDVCFDLIHGCCRVLVAPMRPLVSRGKIPAQGKNKRTLPAGRRRGIVRSIRQG